MTTRYCVTMQIQWPDGTQVVEISSGNEDYTNPDVLSGYFSSHETAMEAVEEAITVALRWQQESDEPVYIGKGYTMGMTMPFDPEDLDEETFAEYRKWAEKQDEELERCDQCDAVLDDDEQFCIDECLPQRFCSVTCCERFEYETAQQWEDEHRQRIRV